MTSSGGTRSLLSASALAAALWLLCAAAYAFASWNSLVPQQFVAHALPETIPGGVWQLPMPWPLFAVLASTVLVFLLYLWLASTLAEPGQSRRTRFLVLWFIAIASGFLATLPWALSQVIAGFPPARAGWLLNPVGEYLLQSGYWGILWGWLPALIGVLGSAVAPAARSARFRRTLAALIVVTMVASAAVFLTGYRAGRVQQAELTAIDEGQTVGAVPDPDLTATPPPTRLPAVGEIDVAWCTPEQAMVLLSDRDAATGHRVQTIRVMNFSAEPCSLNGYPDIAFADASGSEIVVALEHGATFMASDAGAHTITLEPGGYAKASIGWNAMGTEQELATYELHAAMYPGLERGSWPVKLDIVAGGDVAVTAWELSDAGGGKG